jgi:hypothetical protein
MLNALLHDRVVRAGLAIEARIGLLLVAAYAGAWYR